MLGTYFSPCCLGVIYRINSLDQYRSVRAKRSWGRSLKRTVSLIVSVTVRFNCIHINHLSAIEKLESWEKKISIENMLE